VLYNSRMCIGQQDNISELVWYYQMQRRCNTSNRTQSSKCNCSKQSMWVMYWMGHTLERNVFRLKLLIFFTEGIHKQI